MAILQVENITKSYGKELVLNNVSFNIPYPKIVALVGPNGSGKTTLLNIITNLLKPDSGNIQILGRPNTDPNIFYETSFMQDNSVLYEYLTGYDHLQFIADVQNLSKEQILKTSQLVGNDGYLHKKVKNYSLGMKQHLLLAMAILNKPKLLILDEPLNGLDPTSAIRVRELIIQLHKEGTTILISSHNLGEIDRITSNIIFIKNGQIIEEDLSEFEQVTYYLSVSNQQHAIKILKEQQIPVILENNRLKIWIAEKSLQTVISVLLNQGVSIKDIEKKITGSEERYQQIFSKKDEVDETIEI